MRKINVELPYHIGTYFVKEENGIEHIDQLHEYIINRSGVSVVLTLDVLSEPRLSTPIDLASFINNWTPYIDLENRDSSLKR